MVTTILIAQVWGLQIPALVTHNHHADHYMILDTQHNESPFFWKKQSIFETPPPSFLTKESSRLEGGNRFLADRTRIGRNAKHLDEQGSDHSISSNFRIEQVKNHYDRPLAVYNGVPGEPVMKFEQNEEGMLRWIPKKRFLLATSNDGAVLDEELYDFMVYPLLTAIQENRANRAMTHYLHAKTWQARFREFYRRTGNISNTVFTADAKYTMFHVEHEATKNWHFDSLTVGPPRLNENAYARFIKNEGHENLHVIQTGITSVELKNIVIPPGDSAEVLFDPMFPWVLVSSIDGEIDEKTYDCLIRMPLTKARKRGKEGQGGSEQPWIADSTSNSSGPGNVDTLAAQGVNRSTRP
ncbi:hypothetical protein PGT21_026583 [Puccinia graminis f. sp. tritici]|nr:hypothetical protein PGT21_024655 [Puccinia graminis f. sp. tritici]KAA1078004.1 hypothetical protein PGT21_026583 [Puccinia graminis f. sp. tritici]